MPVKKGKNCVGDEMHRWKSGDLHSGKNGPVVKDRKQALAIAISECNHSERLQSMGFSQETSDAVATLLDFSNSNLDWGKQFDTGKGPGEMKNPDLGPADRHNPKELVSKKARENNPKQDEPEMLSGPALPKGPGNPMGGSSKEVLGLRMLG